MLHHPPLTHGILESTIREEEVHNGHPPDRISPSGANLTLCWSPTGTRACGKPHVQDFSLDAVVEQYIVAGVRIVAGVGGLSGDSSRPLDLLRNLARSQEDRHLGTVCDQRDATS